MNQGPTTDDHIGFLIKTINDRIRQNADLAFSEFDLTGSQVNYLAYLTEQGGSASQKSIEDYFNVSHPTVIGIIFRMKEKGYVTVTTDEKDRRSRIVTMTQKAYDVKKELNLGRVAMNEAILQGFSGDEKEQLLSYLMRIQKNTESLAAPSERRKQ